jgi:hypothetical protein
MYDFSVVAVPAGPPLHRPRIAPVVSPSEPAGSQPGSSVEALSSSIRHCGWPAVVISVHARLFPVANHKRDKQHARSGVAAAASARCRGRETRKNTGAGACKCGTLHGQDPKYKNKSLTACLVVRMSRARLKFRCRLSVACTGWCNQQLQYVFGCLVPIS